MEEHIQKLVELLSLLRADSISYQTNPHSLDKYADLMFLGDKYNVIFTNELLVTFNDYFQMNISNDLLQKIIPTACKLLNMDCEPMKALKDLNSPTPYCYQVTLW